MAKLHIIYVHVHLHKSDNILHSTNNLQFYFAFSIAHCTEVNVFRLKTESDNDVTSVLLCHLWKPYSNVLFCSDPVGKLHYYVCQTSTLQSITQATTITVILTVSYFPYLQHIFHPTHTPQCIARFCRHCLPVSIPYYNYTN